jgi:flagellar L-ring protein precursor FlgH
MTITRRCGAASILALLAGLPAWSGGKQKAGELSPIDEYIQQATARAAERHSAAGSLYTPAGLLGDIARDLRASQVDDLVTIVVSDRASAVARGATSTARKSDAKASVSALFGPTRVGGTLADLARLSGEQELEGQGETSRQTVLTTTLSARVTHILPNGYLVVQGIKDISINSERQQVSVRGVIRWNDIGPGNLVGSDRLANLEVRVNGKGVVEDAIRRPNFLYRLLLGLLPF